MQILYRMAIFLENLAELLVFIQWNSQRFQLKYTYVNIYNLHVR